MAGPDTVGIIDGRHDVLSGVVTGAARPGGVAYGAGATWITDTADDQLLRVNHSGQVVDRIPVGRGPGGVAVGDGQVWVANQLDGTVWEVNPAAGIPVARIGVGNGPDAVAFGYRSVWVANETDGTLSRIDAGSGRLLATIPLGGTPAGLAAGEGTGPSGQVTGRCAASHSGRTTTAPATADRSQETGGTCGRCAGTRAEPARP